MSQALPPKAGEKDDPGPPIEGREQLLRYFSEAAKPRDQFKIGTEHEKFGFNRRTLAPLEFDGARGIEAILRAIAADPLESKSKDGPWNLVEEEGRAIALYRAGASITLEPGGQLELSGAPLRTLHETCDEVGHHLSLLQRVCRPLGVGFIGIGFQPTASWDEMPTVPKSRYGIMRRYMTTVGSRGLDMMKRTSTVQANFDYSSEADMVATFRTALAVSPLCTALFANSPFVEGAPSGRVSERAFVWTDTDPARSGFPSIVFDDDFGYERWLDYVLDVPMYFIRRDGIHHDYAGRSFRDFIADGIDGHAATLRDFEDQLTVVFPEVRLKRFIEVRGADCGPWSRICALPALYKGLLYNDDAKAEAYALMDTPTAPELKALHKDVAERGFRAEYRGTPILERCRRLVDISAKGLEAWQAETGGRQETGFLRSLREQLDRGQTYSEWLVELYETKWNKSLDPMWGEIEFFDEGDDE